MNKGMAMVAVDELKKAREEAIKFSQETDNVITMLIGYRLDDRNDADVIEAVKQLKTNKVKYHNACARIDKVMNMVCPKVCIHKDPERIFVYEQPQEGALYADN